MVPGYVRKELVFLELLKRESLFGIGKEALDEAFHFSTRDWFGGKGELGLEEKDGDQQCAQHVCLLGVAFCKQFCIFQYMCACATSQLRTCTYNH